jgi:hypothetical protein
MGMTEFVHPQHRGICRRITVDPAREFVVGVDLGKSVDSTVIAIVEYVRVGTGEFEVSKASSQRGITITKEKYCENFDLRELQRLKLQTTYDEVIEHLVGLMNAAPLREAELVIDDSGVGRPIGDMIEAQTALRPIRVTTTGGEQANNIGARRWHVPKQELVSVLSGLFATNRIRLAHDLPNLEVLRREAQTFLRTYTSSGRSTFSAASGQHDDTISALSLACWWATMKYSPSWSHRRGGEFSIAFVRGMI